MHLRPSRNFSICFPIAACKQALVSPYRGVTQAGKERMFNLLSSPCPPPPPPPPSQHLNLSPPSACIWLVAVQPRLSGFQQVSLSWAGWGGFMCVPASHLQTWSPQNAPPEYVLLEGLCPFPVWIGKYAAWQNGLLSANGSILPTGPGACDKCLHVWLSTRIYGKNWVIYLNYWP